jgi:anthranilate phosphoribosyltransferase
MKPVASMHSMQWKDAIAQALRRQDFTAAQSAELFGAIMDGEATPAQMAGILIALAAKGETAAELTGAAKAMRERAVPLDCSTFANTVDTCGTGGDNSGSVNVSTLAAMMVAACGGTVVKHGNRALSSKAGSADVLESLGVRIDATAAQVQSCISQCGIGFAFAPTFHAATRHAAGTRRELGVRTMFNLLGPLTNPGRVHHQVCGVFSQQWCAPMVDALGALGCRRAIVVHGASGDGRGAGTDEVSVDGITHAEVWDHGTRRSWTLKSADFGMPACDVTQLAGGDAAFNASVLTAVLAGQHCATNASRFAVAAAASMTAGLALMALHESDGNHPMQPDQLPAFTSTAMASLQDGRAQRLLASWVAATELPGY